jgi:hypothetical protein
MAHEGKKKRKEKKKKKLSNSWLRVKDSGPRRHNHE